METRKNENEKARQILAGATGDLLALSKTLFDLAEQMHINGNPLLGYVMNASVAIDAAAVAVNDARNAVKK